MILIMQKGDICVVEATLPNSWGKLWYFASVVEFSQDRQDNWDISKVRIVGEQFDRDDAGGFEGCYRLANPISHKRAQKLVAAQWVPIGYPDLDAVRAAINAPCA